MCGRCTATRPAKRTGETTHLQQLSGQDNDRRGAVAHLLVLQVAGVHEHACRGVSDLQLLQDGGAIVRNSDVTDVINLFHTRPPTQRVSPPLLLDGRQQRSGSE